MNMQMEDLQAILEKSREQREAADNAASPLQKAITWGDYVLSRDPNSGVYVFGMLTPRETLIAEETEGIEDEYLVKAIKDEIDERHRQHLRFGRFFSSLDENTKKGEHGTKHVVSLWPISKEDFEAAEANGWEASESLIDRVQDEVANEDFDPPPFSAMFVIDPEDDLQVARLAELYAKEESREGITPPAAAVAEIHFFLKRALQAYRDELLEEETHDE